MNVEMHLKLMNALRIAQMQRQFREFSSCVIKRGDIVSENISPSSLCSSRYMVVNYRTVRVYLDWGGIYSDSVHPYHMEYVRHSLMALLCGELEVGCKIMKVAGIQRDEEEGIL